MPLDYVYILLQCVDFFDTPGPNRIIICCWHGLCIDHDYPCILHSCDLFLSFGIIGINVALYMAKLIDKPDSHRTNKRTGPRGTENEGTDAAVKPEHERPTPKD
jgi:hypothetical protein